MSSNSDRKRALKLIKREVKKLRKEGLDCVLFYRKARRQLKYYGSKTLRKEVLEGTDSSNSPSKYATEADPNLNRSFTEMFADPNDILPMVLSPLTDTEPTKFEAGSDFLEEHSSHDQTTWSNMSVPHSLYEILTPVCANFDKFSSSSPTSAGLHQQTSTFGRRRLFTETNRTDDHQRRPRRNVKRPVRYSP